MHGSLVEYIMATVKRFRLQVDEISPLNQFKSESSPQPPSLLLYGSLWFLKCNLPSGMRLAEQTTLLLCFYYIC